MKALTLAIVAALAVGASAQTRHYTTKDGMVTALPSGQIVETRLVEVTPVLVVPASNRTMLYSVPESQARALNVRHYDTIDTADTSDELRDSRNMYYDYLYETRSTTIRSDD